MGKKQKKKEEVVLNLADFVGGEEEVLPSAPKGAEEWEAQGIPAFGRHAGRPARDAEGGRRERSSGFRGEGEFEREQEADHGWVRRGPLEAAGGGRAGFGGGGEDRDWGERKMAPAAMDAAGGPRGGSAEIDWSQRKGPVTAEFNSARGGPEQSDWSRARRGPPPPLADGPPNPQAEVDFRDVRGSAVSSAPGPEPDLRAARDAAPAGPGPNQSSSEVDFRDVRGSAVSARSPTSNAATQQDVDFKDVRGTAVAPASRTNGTSAETDLDWKSRQGPQGGSQTSEGQKDGNQNSGADQVDWGTVRKGPPPPAVSEKTKPGDGVGEKTKDSRAVDIDWSQRKVAPAAAKASAKAGEGKATSGRRVSSSRGGDSRADDNGEWVRRGAPPPQENGARRGSAADDDKSWRTVEGPSAGRKVRDGPRTGGGSARKGSNSGGGARSTGTSGPRDLQQKQQEQPPPDQERQDATPQMSSSGPAAHAAGNGGEGVNAPNGLSAGA
mmetsp:Transcript_16642/g.36185  ORF Transcript_16642/g.36185 Transcript_16642/m.36185 type:complete len:496 (+) Transcript_16642:37-1524(+)